MKRLLWIKDYKKFWQAFDKQREKERKRLRSLPFAKKIEMMSRMQRISFLKRVKPVRKGRTLTLPQIKN
jgi:hypothetical protein